MTCHNNKAIQRERRPDDEIDLRELFYVIWQAKWWIVGFTFFTTAIAIAIALSLPDKYKSEALLAPVQGESDSLGGLAAKYGGLASLAGISLPSGGGGDNTALGIEKLKTREFVFEFIEKHELLVPIMAAIGWNYESNSLLIDDDVFDVEARVWVRSVSYPLTSKPSLQEAFERFSESFSVSQDRDTGFVRISIEHYSPHVSKQWVDWIIEDIDRVMREKDIQDAQRSIEYLNNQIQNTDVAEVRAMLSELVQGKIETLMLAKVRDQYLFDVIDPAIATERPSRPNRVLIIMLTIISTIFLGCVLAIIKHSFKSESQ